MTDCDCDEWATGTAALNSAIFIAENHGAKYNITPFIFCPWCGVRADPEWRDTAPDE